ncbi:MAG TPA: SseB family protein [Polyangiales bacterium]|nr:SseB family protein [Polyangiales bacterium]
MATRDNGVDQATGAFRRVLAEANLSEKARVDALVAFSQRTVLAATWPGAEQPVRTLTNREGETAMPLFTALDVLDETATRFGWRNPDGSLPMRTLDAREALRHALARGVHFVVVDIGCDHAVEFGRGEIEPLLSLPAQNAGGPFAATGEPEAAILDAVRRSSRPPGMHAHIDAPFANLKPGAVPQTRPHSRPLSQPMPTNIPSPRPRPLSQPLGSATLLEGAPRTQSSQNMPAARPPSQPLPGARPPSRPLSQPMTPAARPGSQQNMAAVMSHDQARAQASSLAQARPPSVMPPAMDSAEAEGAAERADATGSHPTAGAEAEADRESGERALGAGDLPDPLLQAMSQGMRGFPEVEWACVLNDGSDLPVIGVRVDPSFLNRVAQITDAIFDIGAKSGQEVQVLLLNTPELVKNARKNGKAFYPWKR